MSLEDAPDHETRGGADEPSPDHLRAAAEHYREAIALYTLHEPCAFGVQTSRAFCVRALKETLRRLSEDDPSIQPYRE